MLAYVANALEPFARKERADRAFTVISQNFIPKRWVFFNFVLSRYLALGVEELDKTKPTSLLKLKYTTRFRMIWPIWAV